MSNERATEIDQLLPTPRDRRQHYYLPYSLQQHRRRLFFFGASFFTLFMAIYFCMARPSKHKYHKTRERSYKPSEQLRELNYLTQSSLGGILINLPPNKASNGGNTVPKQNTTDVPLSIDGTQSSSNNIEIYECSSQVVIMRHCEKDVKTRDKNGRIRIHDRRDIFGDGHCSPQGTERSAYIATLFVANDEFPSLLNRTKATVDDLSDAPLVPAVDVSNAPADVKPQFPSPLKLYALNEARYNKNPTKEHKNFREVETVTPLADKFNLVIDERFGVNEEGDLAIDFFTSLSESVKMNIDRTVEGTDESQERESQDEMRKLGLCQNGMTVINWKHSLIPNLARALGCGKKAGCPSNYDSHDFDTIWVITYDYSLPLVIAKPPNSTLSPVENLWKRLLKPSNHKHRGLNHMEPTASDTLTWKISAQTVKEGFDQVH